jgi:hypothetical protein
VGLASRHPISDTYTLSCIALDGTTLTKSQLAALLSQSAAASTPTMDVSLRTHSIVPPVLNCIAGRQFVELNFSGD